MPSERRAIVCDVPAAMAVTPFRFQAATGTVAGGHSGPPLPSCFYRVAPCYGKWYPPPGAAVALSRPAMRGALGSAAVRNDASIVSATTSLASFLACWRFATATADIGPVRPLRARSAMVRHDVGAIQSVPSLAGVDISVAAHRGLPRGLRPPDLPRSLSSSDLLARGIPPTGLGVLRGRKM